MINFFSSSSQQSEHSKTICVEDTMNSSSRSVFEQQGMATTPLKNQHQANSESARSVYSPLLPKAHSTPVLKASITLAPLEGRSPPQIPCSSASEVEVRGACSEPSTRVEKRKQHRRRDVSEAKKRIKTIIDFMHSAIEELESKPREIEDYNDIVGRYAERTKRFRQAEETIHQKVREVMKREDQVKAENKVLRDQISGLNVELSLANQEIEDLKRKLEQQSQNTTLRGSGRRQARDSESRKRLDSDVRHIFRRVHTTSRDDEDVDDGDDYSYVNDDRYSVSYVEAPFEK